MESSVKINFKRTRKGKISKIVEENYLRDDVPIPFLERSGIDEEISQIYILDTETLIKQIDLIEKCSILNNVVILQTVLEDIKTKDQKTFETIKNIIEIETHRNFQIFANEFFKVLNTPKEIDETWQQRNQRAVHKAVLWYVEQANLQKKDVLFITNSFKSYDIAAKSGIKTKTIYDFVQDNATKHPDLLDYLGFGDESLDVEDEGSNIYDPHLSVEEAVLKVKKGSLFEGKLNINRNNIEEGTLNLIKYGIEIKIFGKKNLNRAMHGERVCVELLPENEWRKLNIVNLEDEDDAPENPIVDIEEESDMKHLLDKIRKEELTPCGKVVCVLKRIGRNFCGHLEPLEKQREGNEGFEIRKFVPADSRFPNILLKIRKNGELDTKKLIARIDNWGTTSEYPKGHFVSVIGEIGDPRTEGDVILLEHNVEFRPFSRQVLDCLPGKGDDWQIPAEEYKSRRDFRDICVCSIDPPGCKDIDDALHARLLPNGNIEIGVHIADVSYFVRPDTPIDLEAANRCTTVYLVGRRTDMLPKLLTENLCSLKGNVERLTFSVVWEMTPDAQCVNVEYTKGIIKSRAAMTYDDAQKMLDNPSDTSEIANSVRLLNKIAKIIRQRRVEAGALTLASTQVKFTFSDETHDATDVSLYKLGEANFLVEEFMLLGNIYVAEKILYHFPSNSVLRKHSTPKPKQIKDFAKLLSTLGYNLDYSSSRNLADSLDRIDRKKDPFFNKLIRILTTRTMNEAQYFCTADFDYPEYHHYGLACDTYTHFTSPIRRYADVLVHRLLAAAIDIESLPKTMANKQKLAKMTDKMNMRNRNARNAGRASSDYEIFIFFRNKKENNQEKAAISNITHDGFNIILEKYGLEGFIALNEEDKKVHLNRIKELQAQSADYIVNEVICKGDVLKIFDYVNVSVRVEMHNFHKKIYVDYLSKVVL